MRPLPAAWLLALLGGLSVVASAAGEFAVTPFSTAAPAGPLPVPWKLVTLPNVSRHTKFTLVRDGDATVLRAEAHASMASVTHALKLDPGLYPVIEWRWKVENILQKSDIATKQGDDYPARVYVLFDYDVRKLSLLERARILLARTIYGADVPPAALCYVWDGKAAAGSSAWSAYTRRVRMIVVESGSANLKRWMTARRNVAEDFRAAFGEEPPAISGVAIVTDTDNTGESAVAYFGDIRFLAAAPVN